MAWLSVEDPSRIEPTFSLGASSAPVTEPLDGGVRAIRANIFLFRRGDPRTHVFRVESGAVCLYESGRTDRQSVIEFLFPGDFVGLGFLEKHCLSARALVDTSVTCLTIDAAAEIIREDPRAKAKLATAIEREFEIRREELRGAGQRQPIERVAALLITSARTNVQQGRAADLIEDSWRCGVIADLLRLSLDSLTAILVEFERRGLVEATADGLRLTDIAALEALADGVRPAGDESVAGPQTKPARPPKLLPTYIAA
jgi:CRP/FNR family transcriptional regulator, anaerobic regulatory protein